MSGMLFGATGGPMQNSMLSVFQHDGETDERWKSRSAWTYQLRSGQQARDQNPFFGSWSMSSMLGGGWASADAVAPTKASPFESMLEAKSGFYRPYFVKGVVYDGSSAIVVGANCDCYVTATDTWAGSGTTDPSGTYSIGSIFLGQNHYVAVNYNNNQLVGLSRNDLQPQVNP